MTSAEIVLLIIGFASICVSFFVAKKTESESSVDVENLLTENIWSEKEEKMIQDRVTQMLKDYQMDLVDDTENQMNRLCNDKIMAIDEFSRQILAKIDANHQEVVFMYNMLNEKEKEVSQYIQTPVSLVNSEKPQMQPVKEVSKAREQDAFEEGTEPKSSSKRRSKGKTGQRAQSQNQTESRGDRVIERDESMSEYISTSQTETSEEIQEQIQKMYREGKSVLDISKELKIGQGEVKLVIALYGGRRK